MENVNEQIKKELQILADSFNKINALWYKLDQKTDERLCEKYPFVGSFDGLSKDVQFWVKHFNLNQGSITYKGIDIDYSKISACIIKPKFKGFASDETKTGKSALEKAKLYVDNLNLKTN